MGYKGTSIASLLTLVVVSGTLERESQASCSAPVAQMSPDPGQNISSSCRTIWLAVPDPDQIDLKDFELEWSGERTRVTASKPVKVVVQQGEPYIDPKTCKELFDSWDVVFWVYELTAQQPLPLDTEIRVVNGEQVFGDFKVSEAASFCPTSVTPTVSMCGSGAPVPVEGCGDVPVPPASDGADEGGCSVSGTGGGPTTPLALLGLLALLYLRRAGRTA